MYLMMKGREGRGGEGEGGTVCGGRENYRREGKGRGEGRTSNRCMVELECRQVCACSMYECMHECMYAQMHVCNRIRKKENRLKKK